MSRTVEQRESMYILEQYFQYTYTRASDDRLHVTLWSL